MFARTSEAFRRAAPVVAVLVAFSLCGFGRVYGEAPPAPPKPQELRVLERLVGNWDGAGATTVLDSQPVKLPYTGARTRQWILDGRFIEETGKDTDGNEVRVLFTFDAQTRQFRMWYFDARGTNTDALGTWDEASQTLATTKDLGNGLTQSGKIHFIDANSHEWTSAVKDAAGKVLWEGGGKLTRKK